MTERLNLTEMSQVVFTTSIFFYLVEISDSSCIVLEKAMLSPISNKILIASLCIYV